MVVAPASKVPVTFASPLTVNSRPPSNVPPPITAVERLEAPEFNVPVVVLPVTFAEASVDAPAFNVPLRTVSPLTVSSSVPTAAPPPIIVLLSELPILVGVVIVPVLMFVAPNTVVVLETFPILVADELGAVLISVVPEMLVAPTTVAPPFMVDNPATVLVPPTVRSEVPPSRLTSPLTANLFVPNVAPLIARLAIDVAPLLNVPVTVADDIVVAPVTPRVPTRVVFPSTLRFASRSVLPFTFKVPPITVALVPEPILVVALPVLLMSVGPRIVVVLAALPILVPVVFAPVLSSVVPFVTRADVAVPASPLSTAPNVDVKRPLTTA